MGEHCLKEVDAYFAVNPKNFYRHPARIAKEINEAREYVLPFRMLTAIVGKQQEVLREKERKRSVAVANDFRKVKKPGSAARRGKGSDHRIKKSGAKKRGVKG